MVGDNRGANSFSIALGLAAFSLLGNLFAAYLQITAIRRILQFSPGSYVGRTDHLVYVGAEIGLMMLLIAIASAIASVSCSRSVRLLPAISLSLSFSVIGLGPRLFEWIVATHHLL
jgi:hypothetical protein